MKSTIYSIKYNGRDESDRARCLSGLATADEILLRAARTPAVRWGRKRSVPDPVPRVALDRARPTAAHEPARRHVVVRRLERDRTGRSPGIPRSGPAAAFAAGPPRESASADANRRA